MLCRNICSPNPPPPASASPTEEERLERLGVLIWKQKSFIKKVDESKGEVGKSQG